MKKILLSVAVAALALASCTSTRPVCATSNNVGGKTGSSVASVLFGVFFIDGGDFSIKTAADKGGIKKISTVDLKTTNYAFIYGINETIVTGE